MANEEKHEKYVTELAGEGDRWVSVTDAARIARRQEKTIRDWVESGRLPVHPVRVGLNKRTRQVRLSDLATLTPIVDPEAGIATDLGLLDLPSIPRELQRVVEQMATLQQAVSEQVAELTAQLGTLASQHESFVAETRTIWGVHQEQYRALDRRDEALQQLIYQAREDWTAHLQEVNRAIGQEIARVQASQEQLDGRVAALVQELQQVRGDWMVQLREVRTALGQEIADVRALHQRLDVQVATLALDLQQMRQSLTDQAEQSALALRQAVTAQSHQLAEVESLLRQERVDAVHGIEGVIEALDARLAKTSRDRQDAHVQLQALTDERYTETHRQISQFQAAAAEQDAATSRRLTELSGATEAMQKRAEAAEQEAHQLRRDLESQVQTQQELAKHLATERKAREALAKQVEKLLQQSQPRSKGRGPVGE